MLHNKEDTKKGNDLSDYKIWCFDGKPHMTLVCSDRFIDLKEDFYDNEWRHLDIRRPSHSNSEYIIPKPYNFELMKCFAEKLSTDMPFARIDFYEINKKIYFGEITLYPASGFEGFIPTEWDNKLGNMILI